MPLTTQVGPAGWPGARVLGAPAPAPLATQVDKKSRKYEEMEAWPGGLLGGLVLLAAAVRLEAAGAGEDLGDVELPLTTQVGPAGCVALGCSAPRPRWPWRPRLARR